MKISCFAVDSISCACLSAHTRFINHYKHVGWSNSQVFIFKHVGHLGLTGSRPVSVVVIFIHLWSGGVQ